MCKGMKTDCMAFLGGPPAKYDFLQKAPKLKLRAEESKAHINTAEQELCSNVKLPNK